MKVGDKLYKYQGWGKIAEYVCTAIIVRDKLTQYEIECQSCLHGFNCVLLVKKVRGENRYEFLAMVNDDTEEYKCWHTTYHAKEMFYENTQEAKEQIYISCIYDKEKEIKEQTSRLDRLNKELEDIKAHYENVKIKKDEPK